MPATIPTLDVTGGSPELNPTFRELISAAARIAPHVKVRTNLTVLIEPSQADLPEFLAERGVELVASLPCYTHIRADALMELAVADRAFGWAMEMQAKAARARLRTIEVPVSYRRRIGKSKITGTLSGSAKAGLAIIGMALRARLWPPDRFA